MEHKVKFLEYAFAKSGTAFKDTTLENILYNCLKFHKNGKKNQYGSVFIYNSDRLGEHLNDEKSLGIILIDIDHISKNVADLIYDNFDKLVQQWPSLLAIQFSSSYYINPNKNGLHIYVESYELDYNEYKIQSQICLAIFAQLVYKVLNIDLQKLGTKKEPVLDLHNTILYQRFNLFYSTFKYNENTIPFDLSQITFEDLEKLSIKYNIEFDKKVSNIISPVNNNIELGNVDKRIKVDRNLVIGQYKGNDIRWRISVIFDKLFGDNAKLYCDKYFYYENGKSIYTHYSSANIINPLIYKWLLENNYIVSQHHNTIEKWIDEYTNTIVNEIRKNRQLGITAPTCSGKTTFINTYLANEFNSVVIVPFNVTNKLYNNLIEVNSTYVKTVPQNKPVVMVWDQAVKHWDEIKHRHLIIDESHTLFLDRNYRDSAIRLMNKIKEENSYATFITATPSGEFDFFNLETLKFFKKRDDVILNIKTTKNIEWSQFNYIKKCVDNNWYDRIVLLDDISAKKIYEQLIIEGYGENICYIRSNTKESKDFIDLRENELLKKKINICTCIAFNGLNFKNENENILIVGSIQLGNTTSCRIIQQIGRIRNSRVTAVYFYDPEKYYKEDIDSKELKAQEFNNLVLKGVPDSFLLYNRKYLDSNFTEALRSIQDYTLKHSSIETIIQELSITGYIKGTVDIKLKNNDVITMNLAMKRKESNIMKEDILNDEFLEKEYESEYSKNWSKDIRYMISNGMYSGITMDSFKKMIKKGTKNKLIETYINNVKNIIKYIQVDEREYQNTIKNVNLYASMLSSVKDKKQFITNIKKIKEIRENYIDKIKFNNNVLELNDIIVDVINWEYEQQCKKLIGNTNGGKKGSPIKHCIITDKIKPSILKKYHLTIGQEFDSAIDLAKYINLDTHTITKWRRKKWIK